MMPAATPQTATRSTRSGSPPRRFQRTQVSQMAATIASSSIRPYRWIGRPKIWKTPLCGDGIEASRKFTGATFCRSGRKPAYVFARAGSRRPPEPGSLARSDRSRDAGRRRAVPPVRPPRGPGSRPVRALPHATLGPGRARCPGLALFPPQSYSKIRSSAAFGSPLSGGFQPDRSSVGWAPTDAVGAELRRRPRVQPAPRNPPRHRARNRFSARLVRVLERREDRVPAGEIEADLGRLDLDPLVGTDLALGPDEAALFDDLDVVLLATHWASKRRHNGVRDPLDRDARALPVDREVNRDPVDRGRRVEGRVEDLEERVALLASPDPAERFVLVVRLAAHVGMTAAAT